MTKAQTRLAGSAIELDTPEPWPDPVDGASLLDDVVALLREFVVLPPHACEAVALWVAFTYADDVFDVSPRLALTSPEPRCGKTTALELVGALCDRPLFAANVSAAAIFRTIEAHRPVLLLDEVDAWLGHVEDARGLLNSGHRRGGAVIRLVGDNHEPRSFSTWAPVATAGIGKLAATLMDRAIVVPLRRRAEGETVSRLRVSKLARRDELRSKLKRFAEDSRAELEAADCEPPATLNDRAADNWRPLLAIAQAAGGAWPVRAADAAVALSNSSATSEPQTAGVELLSDLRAVFAELGVERAFSATLLAALNADETRPWGEWAAGKPLSATQLARLLKRFDVRPQTLRIGADRAKGYCLGDFQDVFQRYLPVTGPTSRDVVTIEQNQTLAGLSSRDAIGERHGSIPRQPSENIDLSRCHGSQEGEPSSPFRARYAGEI